MLIGLLGAMSAVAEERSASPTEFESFHASMAREDREAVLASLAADVVIFEGGGAELSRSEYALHHLAGDLEFVGSTNRTVVDQRAAVDGDVAWVLTRSETKGSFRDRDIDSRGTETMVLKRGSEGWQIVHIHWSSRTSER